jgi:hypothetical protein
VFDAVLPVLAESFARRLSSWEEDTEYVDAILLCAEKDHAVAQYALEGLPNDSRPTEESRGAASNGTSMANAPEPPGMRFGAIHAAARRSLARCVAVRDLRAC